MRYYCDTRLNAQTLLRLVLHYCGTYHVGYRYLPKALHWTLHSKRTNQGGSTHDLRVLICSLKTHGPVQRGVAAGRIPTSRRVRSGRHPCHPRGLTSVPCVPRRHTSLAGRDELNRRICREDKNCKIKLISLTSSIEPSCLA